MDGSVSIIEEYASWLSARCDGKRAYSFPIGATHDNIVKELNKGRFSFEEVVELFAGVLASRYCQDRADARVALGIFAEKLFELVREEERDEDVETVDRIDAGGW